MFLDFNTLTPPLLTSRTPFLDRYWPQGVENTTIVFILHLILSCLGHKPQGHHGVLPSSSYPNRLCWRRHWHFYQSPIFPALTPFLRGSQPPQCVLMHRHQNYFPKHKCHFPGQKFFNSFPFPTESRPKSSVHIIQDSNLAQLPSSPRALLLSSTMCQAVLRVETESPCSHGAHVSYVSKIKSTHSSTFSPVPYMRIIFFF